MEDRICVLKRGDGVVQLRIMRGARSEIDQLGRCSRIGREREKGLPFGQRKDV